MTTSPAEHLAGMTREVRRGELDGQETVIVYLARTYATDVLDLWDALTSPSRLSRWFLPVSGDLRLGGRYQFEGNAGGTIEECTKPERVKVTWEFGGGKSWVTVELTPQPDGTKFSLAHESHLIPGFTDKFGPGAVGVGWDLGFLGLTRHLEDPTAERPPEADTTWATSPEALDAYRQSSEAWAEADMEYGTPRDKAVSMAEETRRFYSGETPMGGGEAG